jgi:hypothetical protein
MRIMFDAARGKRSPKLTNQAMIEMPRQNRGIRYEWMGILVG